MSSPFFLIKLTKSKKYFGVPPFVTVGAAFSTTFGALLKKSSPKYLRNATAPPAPIDKTISLLVWSTPCWVTLFSISLLILSIAVPDAPRSLICLKSFGAYPIKKKGVAGPGSSPANCNISPVVLCGPDLFLLMLVLLYQIYPTSLQTDRLIYLL